jgi:hypothetical protein
MNGLKSIPIKLIGDMERKVIGDHGHLASPRLYLINTIYLNFKPSLVFTCPRLPVKDEKN